MKPPDALEHARLLLDTLRLAPDAPDASLVERWARADDAALVTLAKYEGAEIWLARRLRALGITLSAASADALDAAALRAHARTMRADAALESVLAAFRATEVECVLLKSAALRRLTARLPFADARTSADVDLLVSPADGDHALGVLRARGWSLLDTADPPQSGVLAEPAPGEQGTRRAVRAAQPKHQLPSVADASGVAIELHCSTGPSVRPMEAWRRAVTARTQAQVGAQAAWVPTDTWLLVHAVTRALADTMESARGGLRLRHWLDGAVLMTGEELRWDLMRERVDSGEMGPSALARAWLWSAAVLAGVAIGIEELGPGELAPLPLERLLAWRLHVLARHAATDRWGQRLLEEGARTEIGLAPELPWQPEPWRVRLRRRSAQMAARASYRWWRLRS